MSSPVLRDDLAKLFPLIYEGQSDTACFDNALELLTMSGYPLAHAMMMMIPEAWEQHTLMDESRRAFYESRGDDGAVGWSRRNRVYRRRAHRCDARSQRSAARALHRDRRRHGRDGIRVGVLPIPESRITKKWRLQPGKMFLIDTEQGRIIDDAELKQQLASSKPHIGMGRRIRIKPDDLPSSSGESRVRRRISPCPARSSAGIQFTQEDVRLLMQPMAIAAEEAVGSMGNDTALPVLRSRQTAIPLLQTAICAGDQPADRSDSRTVGDVTGQFYRAQTQPA